MSQALVPAQSQVSALPPEWTRLTEQQKQDLLFQVSKHQHEWLVQLTEQQEEYRKEMEKYRTELKSSLLAVAQLRGEREEDRKKINELQGNIEAQCAEHKEKMDALNKKAEEVDMQQSKAKKAAVIAGLVAITFAGGAVAGAVAGVETGAIVGGSSAIGLGSIGLGANTIMGLREHHGS